ncbi:MAG: YceK/YidQ family lipoprotein [Planctomycetes bacterium]|nr:YceK/YidQ family lipoprotein [Planctomycetota bacterium]
MTTNNPSHRRSAFMPLALAWCALASTLSGCASALSLASGAKPFGGVQLDGIALQNVMKAGGASEIPLALLAMLDFPFSFTFDVLLLPFTAALG